MQHIQEFGFVGDEDNQKCAIDHIEVAEKLHVYNLIVERKISHMDKCASRATNCSNCKFTARSMQDDITTFEKETKSKEESKWSETQREITKAKPAVKHAKAVHLRIVCTLLNKCTMCNGPFTLVGEIEKPHQNNSNCCLKSNCRNYVMNCCDILYIISKYFPNYFKMKNRTRHTQMCRFKDI